MDDLDLYVKDHEDNDVLDQYVREHSNAKTEIDNGPGAGQSFVEHLGNAAMLGHAPHFQAAVEQLLPDPNADLDEKLRAQGFTIDQPKPSYVASRDANIKRIEQEGKDHPWASGAGTVAGVLGGGAIGSTVLPTAAAGATLAQRMGHAAKIGAGMGALANPGDTEGEINPLDEITGRAKGAALGAAIGPAAELATTGVSNVSQKVKDYLRNKAALKATRALGRAAPSDTLRMSKTGQDVELGRTLLDEGAIPILGTPKRIQGRVEGLKDTAGQEVGDLIKSAGDQKLIDPKKIADEILASPEIEQMRFTPGMEGAAEKIAKQVETLVANGEMSLAEAQRLRQGIDKSINFNKRVPDMGAAQEGLHAQRTKLRDAMNDAINGLGESLPKDRLLSANRKYGNLAQASDILDSEIARNQANRAVSLTDTMAGAAGASTGNPAAALGLGALNKFGRTFGNSMQARGYDAASKGAGVLAGAAGDLAKNVGALQGLAGSGSAAARGGFEELDIPLFKNKLLMDKLKENPRLIDHIQDDKVRALIKKRLGIGRSPADQ